MRQRRTETALVGRVAEMERALEAADDPATGAVLLTGPTGVGKSRLGEGIMSALTSRGWRGFGLSATESTSHIAYASLSELIPEVLDNLDHSERSPHSAESVPGPGPGTSGVAELAVLRGVEAALGLDRAESVVVVIEDIASLDHPSCELMVHLAANRRLFIVASQGPDRGLEEAHRRLTPASVVEIGLEPFGLGETAELAAMMLGGAVGPGLVRNVYARTLGVPLFVRDLVDEARSNGAIEQREDGHQLTGELSMSPSLGRQIVFRLGLLDKAERDVLELLALAGELGIEDLADLIDVDPLEAMEQRGLIRTWTSRRRLRAALGHPLQAEAIVADMTPLVRRRRHRELLRLIERHDLRRAEDGVLHALSSTAAGMTVDTATLVSAVRTALRLDRIKDAASLGRIAFSSDPNEVTRTVFAEAMVRQGRFVEADVLLAEPLPPDTADWDLLRRVIRRSSNQLWGFRNAAEAWRLDADCIARISDPEAIARVVAHQAWIAYCDGRSPEALTLTGDLIDTAHPDVRFAMCVTRAPALVTCGRVEEGAELAQRGWDEGWGADTEFGSHGQHLIALGYAKLYCGDLAAARFVAEVAIADCRDKHEVTPLLFFLDLAGWTEALAGELEAAVSYFDEAAAIGSDLAIASSVRSSIAGATMCRAQLGDHDTTVATWRRLHDVPEAPSPRGGIEVAAAEAWMTVATGDPAEAARMLREAAHAAGEQGLLIYQQLALFDLARIGYATSTEAAMAASVAERCEGELAPFLAEGVGALAAGDPAALDDASARARELGLLLWAAELSARAADEWSSSGDQRAATASQRASEQIRSSIGAVATPALARSTSVEPLTRREREIASLAGSGVSNNEIADRLHVSVRTVETHLHKVYRKLGVHNRGELGDVIGRDT